MEIDEDTDFDRLRYFNRSSFIVSRTRRSGRVRDGGPQRYRDAFVREAVKRFVSHPALVVWRTPGRSVILRRLSRGSFNFVAVRISDAALRLHCLSAVAFSLRRHRRITSWKHVSSGFRTDRPSSSGKMSKRVGFHPAARKARRQRTIMVRHGIVGVNAIGAVDMIGLCVLFRL